MRQKLFVSGQNFQDLGELRRLELRQYARVAQIFRVQHCEDEQPRGILLVRQVVLE